MRLLPYRQYEIESPSTAAEALGRLRANVEPLSFVRLANYRKPFVGEVFESGFRLRPVIRGQTSFSPEITGRIASTPTGTRLWIEVAPNRAVLTMVAVLGGFLGMLIFYHGLTFFTLAGGGLGLCWLLSMGGFWLDRENSRRKLVQLLGPSVESHPIASV